jgi:protein TonB
LGVAAFHALLAWLLVAGFGYRPVAAASDPLKVFSFADPPPPSVEEPVPPPVREAAPEGAASPHSLRARPTPVVAPVPGVRLPAPPTLPTVPEPTIVPPGSASAAGVSTMPGPGTGTGGTGAGTGSGGAGSGTGGGAARAPQWLRGRLANEDYPPAAAKARVQGSVSVRFTVATDGSVGGCQVTRGSGSAELDETTCRVIERRFRYRPAVDAGGRPVPAVLAKTYDWMWVPRLAGRGR